MNRDELLETCLGDTELLPVPREWFNWEDPDRQGHVLAVVGLGLQRVLVRNSVAPGAGIVSAWTTIPVAGIMNVCTDPDRRGEGLASAQIVAALDAARARELTPYAAVFATPTTASFFARFGFHAPAAAHPPGFIVSEIGLDPWPAGEVMTHGRW